MTPSTSSSPATQVQDARVQCKECDFRSHSLMAHVATHGMTVEEYLEKYPGAGTLSEEALVAFKKLSRKATPKDTHLGVSLMGMNVAVDVGTDPTTCLPLPDGYRFPTQGKAHAAFLRAMMALSRGRNAFIWGMPGTGKDALVHAFSALSRKPVVMLTFRPGTDLEPWFYTRALGSSGTSWEYGHLWRALTEGIEGRDGKRRAALVLLSDVDRADEAQAEWFRILTDSISGRILGPGGDMIPLFPGTQFVCTANSCGSGDSRGRMTSKMIDGSILDRLGRKIEAQYLDWADESAILREKFPLLAERAPGIFGEEGRKGELGAATEALRVSIEAETLFAEFTHRGLCEVLKECEDILHFQGRTPKNLLSQGFLAWTEGLDAGSRLMANRLLDPHLVGGAMGPK